MGIPAAAAGISVWITNADEAAPGTHSPAWVVPGVQLLELFARDQGVDLGGRERTVAEQHLHQLLGCQFRVQSDEMNRFIRYQGAIIQDDQIQLIMHREHSTGRAYWVIPGGGREPGETEEACVQREMREETFLEIMVERLLLHEPGIPNDVYKRRKTYLCRVIGGEVKPGYEPEIEAAQKYAIVDVGWFDLRDPNSWDVRMRNDPITFPLVQRIRAVLGYITKTEEQ